MFKGNIYINSNYYEPFYLFSYSFDLDSYNEVEVYVTKSLVS